jgi:hypothetical protein
MSEAENNKINKEYSSSEYLLNLIKFDQIMRREDSDIDLDLGYDAEKEFINVGEDCDMG